MRPTPRLLAQTSLLVLIPAIALVGCQVTAPPATAPGAVSAAPNAGARGLVTLQLGERAAEQRSVLGLGFADTAIAAARVTVLGVDMVQESKTVAWNGTDPLNVSLNVPAGNVRLFKIEALDADPAAATTEPNVRASIRAVSDVAAGGALTINLNYNTDAIGRVVVALQRGLSHGFDKAVHGEAATPADARRQELLAALTGASFTADLAAFVNQVTQYAGPSASAPNGSYAGVHPLYFNADHMVGLMLAGGPTVVTAAPPLPLEAFRAVGQVRVQVGAGNTNFFEADKLELVLQVPFTSFKDGGLFHQDVARPVSLSPIYNPGYGTSALATFELRDVPPGEWGLVARYKGAVVGSGRVKVGHGPVETAIAVAPPALTDVQGAVFDEFGAPIASATVTVTSLDATRPFTGTATTAATGAYKVEGAPANVQLRVAATKAGHTTREQITSQGPAGFGPIGPGVNFGSDGATYGGNGQAFFLSDRPEVVSVQPDAAHLSAGGLGFRVVLSEPLDAANRAKLVRAIEVQFATSVGTARVDHETSFGSDEPMADAPIEPTATWDASNDAVTFGIDAPALRYNDDHRVYRLRLRRPAMDTSITDGNGRRLGFEEPDAGSYYESPFKLGNIGRATFAGNDPSELWEATHVASAASELAPDAVAPQLLSVAVPDPFEIRLTFDEPMVAFAPGLAFTGDRRFIDNGFGPSLLASAYTFVVGADAGAVAGVAMDGVAEAMVLPGQPIPSGVEFAFQADGFGYTAFLGFFNPAAPETIILGSTGSTQLPAGPGAIRVRVRDDATDPAGNAVTPAGATVTATF